MLHVPGYNDSRWGGEWVMVADLSFMSVTFLSFRHSVQDAQVYLLQELQCKDFLAVMKQNHPCIQEKYQVMKWHILMKRWLTAITWTEEDSGCLPKGVTATKMSHMHPCTTRANLCLQPRAPVLRHHHICIASTFAAVTPLCKSMVNPLHLMWLM